MMAWLMGEPGGVTGFYAASDFAGQAIVGKAGIIDQGGQLIAEFGVNVARGQKCKLKRQCLLVGVQGPLPLTG